jgi:hypothetical protein
MGLRMGWVCESCRTENAPAAVFCGMCKKLPGAAGARSASAPPPATSGLELDLPARPAPAQRSAPPPRAVASRSFTSGGWSHVAIEQRGRILDVVWSASLRGRISSVIVGALGALMLWGMRAVSGSPDLVSGDPLARVGWWTGVGIGGFLLVAAVVRIGLVVGHRFDASARQVVRSRSYFGVPLGSSTLALTPGGELTVACFEHRSRYRTTYSFTLRVPTAKGDTTVLVTDDEADANRVARDIATHLG